MHLTALRLAAAVATCCSVAAVPGRIVAQSTPETRQPAMTRHVSTEVEGIAIGSRGTVHVITRYPTADLRVHRDGSSNLVKLDPNFYPVGVGVTAQDTVWIAFSVDRGRSRKSLFAGILPTGRVRNVPVPRSARFVRGLYSTNAMAPTPDGRYLWYAGADGGFTRLALAEMTTISFPRDHEGELTVDRYGTAWFPSRGNLMSVAETGRVAHTYPNAIPSAAGSVLSMSAAQDGTIWFMTARDQHIHWFDPRTQERGDCAKDSSVVRGPGRVQGLRDSAVYAADPQPVEIGRDCIVRAYYAVPARRAVYLSYSPAAGVLAVEGGLSVSTFDLEQEQSFR